MLWARQVLWMIPAGLVVAIGVSVVMACGFRLATGENSDDLTDERDRQIKATGWRVTAGAMSAGFIVALIALALGAPLMAGLNGLLASFALGDTMGNLAKRARYRTGH